jgi:SRSO17 transposase
LELYDRAIGNGLRFDWLTFDEGYGSKPELLRELTARNQRYVAEVPRSFRGWLERPRVVTRPFYRHGRGRGRKVPRLASGTPPARRVDELLDDQRLRDQPWKRLRVKDGEKGPMVWECKHVMLTVKGADGLPAETLHLLVTRNVLEPDELKFFVSNASPETGVATLLLVAFSRWRVERCFEDNKSEIGLDQYEGRRYLGLKRHMLLSAVSYLFLARVRQEWVEKKSGADSLPTARGGVRSDPILGVVVTPSEAEAGGESREEDHLGTASQRPGSKESHKANPTKTAATRHQAHRTTTMQLGHDLAL